MIHAIQPVIKSVSCQYCGHREVPEDNECSKCGAKRLSKRLIRAEQEREEREKE